MARALPATAGADERPLGPGLALAAIGAIGFSGKAIIVKLAYRYQVDAISLLMLRMLFALPLFLFMSWWAGRGKAPLGRRDWIAVLGLGFSGYYLSSFLDFMGLAYITASLERLILYLNPTLVLLFGWILWKRRVTRGQIIGMGISYLGVFVVFGHELQIGRGSDTALGALLVFVSAITYACYMIASGEWVKRLGSLRLTGLASSVASVFCILQYLFMRPADLVFHLAPEVLWLSVLNAVACTALPVLFVMMAIERIGPAIAAQTGMIGPLSTILLGVVLLGEPFTAWVAVGTVLVISGIFVFTRLGR